MKRTLDKDEARTTNFEEQNQNTVHENATFLPRRESFILENRLFPTIFDFKGDDVLLSGLRVLHRRFPVLQQKKMKTKKGQFHLRESTQLKRQFSGQLLGNIAYKVERRGAFFENKKKRIFFLSS